jgi:hypothetical protein
MIESSCSATVSRLDDFYRARRYQNATHVGLQLVELFLGHDQVEDDGEHAGQEDGEEQGGPGQVH